MYTMSQVHLYNIHYTYYNNIRYYRMDTIRKSLSGLWRVNNNNDDDDAMSRWTIISGQTDNTHTAAAV